MKNVNFLHEKCKWQCKTGGISFFGVFFQGFDRWDIRRASVRVCRGPGRCTSSHCWHRQSQIPRGGAGRRKPVLMQFTYGHFPLSPFTADCRSRVSPPLHGTNRLPFWRALLLFLPWFHNRRTRQSHWLDVCHFEWRFTLHSRVSRSITIPGNFSCFPQTFFLISRHIVHHNTIVVSCLFTKSVYQVSKT